MVLDSGGSAKTGCKSGLFKAQLCSRDCPLQGECIEKGAKRDKISNKNHPRNHQYTVVLHTIQISKTMLMSEVLKYMYKSNHSTSSSLVSVSFDTESRSRKKKHTHFFRCVCVGVCGCEGGGGGGGLYW